MGKTSFSTPLNHTEISSDGQKVFSDEELSEITRKNTQGNSQFTSQVTQVKPKGPAKKLTLVRNGFLNTINRGALGSRSTKDSESTSASSSPHDDQWWSVLSFMLTCCLPNFLLDSCSKTKREVLVIQAFREKLALCILILGVMGGVGFITFGFNQTICGAPDTAFQISDVIGSQKTSVFSIFGHVYDSVSTVHPAIPDADFNDGLGGVISMKKTVGGKDLSFMDNKMCHDMSNPPKYFKSTVVKYLGILYANWTEVETYGKQRKWLVYNGAILDVSRLASLKSNLSFLSKDFLTAVNNNLGKDATHAFLRGNFKNEANCIKDIFKIANIDSLTFGCVASRLLLYISFVVVVGIVGLRFILAVFFAAWIGRRLGAGATRSGKEMQRRKGEMTLQRRLNKNVSHQNQPPQNNSGNIEMGQLNQSAVMSGGPDRSMREFTDMSKYMDEIESDPTIIDPTRLHCIIMVPCYSEDEVSLKKTLDSAAKAYYPATHKVILVVADGIVQGHGNSKPTADICVNLMEVDDRFRDEDPHYGNQPEGFEYKAIGEGMMESNYAKVYAGWYRYNETPEKIEKKRKFKNKEQASMAAISQRKEGRVPMLLVVKCGNDEERESKMAKPGNRGKRDSQILVMSFLSKVMFDEHMSELEFDLFYKLWIITGVHPDRYEALMCLDADTEIYPDSMTHMVACLINDPNIMGLCGETRIANKWASWVTMIQVFEYYISHHLAKAFESVFGGVTCLPGCFSMYRIKSPKPESGYYVPILANPDIVEEYSENIVDTLHKKNLLLLGEDRLLTTLMLRTFPKRSMIFVPLAICKTVVPDKIASC
ncbi:Chitin synthase, class 3 [Nowakowskiella sp. JEL0078]|nr:Chitin synthase, class 3 [Nowakowskiella sp. JEL0078]